MKQRIFSLLVLCVLAACSSPASGTSFVAPQGWGGTPGIAGRFQMWMHNNQVLMIIRGDKSMTLSDMEHQTAGTSSLQTTKTENVTLCGKQPAQHFFGTGEPNRNGQVKRTQLEGMLTEIGDSRYLVMYVYPLHTQPDGQAETALHSICPK